MPLVGRNYYEILWLLSTMISNICYIIPVTIFLITLQEWCLHPILTDNIIQTHIGHSYWNLYIHVRSLLIFFYRYRFSSKRQLTIYFHTTHVRSKHSSFLIFCVKLIFQNVHQPHQKILIYQTALNIRKISKPKIDHRCSHHFSR